VAKAKKILVASKRATEANIFPKVMTFYWAISLCYKASLVSHNLIVLSLFVLEHPFGANHIESIRRNNQRPDLVSLKVLQLFMHDIDPTRIRKSVSNISRLTEQQTEC
jgi:hypothetical protein